MASVYSKKGLDPIKLITQHSEADSVRELVETTWPFLDDGVKKQLLRYALLVRQWSPKMNLVSASSDRTLVEILFADAITLFYDRQCGRYLRGKQRVLDVGSGAGAPAIPLAILATQSTFTLYEPRQKRVAFLNTVIGQLNLSERVNVRADRLEPTDLYLQQERFDTAMSRATFAPEAWLELGLQAANNVLLFVSDPIDSSKAHRSAYLEYALPFSKTRRVIEVYCSENISRA